MVCSHGDAMQFLSLFRGCWRWSQRPIRRKLIYSYEIHLCISEPSSHRCPRLCLGCVLQFLMGLHVSDFSRPVPMTRTSRTSKQNFAIPWFGKTSHCLLQERRILQPLFPEMILTSDMIFSFSYSWFFRGHIVVWLSSSGVNFFSGKQSNYGGQEYDTVLRPYLIIVIRGLFKFFWEVLEFHNPIDHLARYLVP